MCCSPWRPLSLVCGDEANPWGVRDSIQNHTSMGRDSEGARERGPRLAASSPSHVPFSPLDGAASAEASAGTAFQRHHSLHEGCVGTDAEA